MAQKQKIKEKINTKKTISSEEMAQAKVREGRL